MTPGAAPRAPAVRSSTHARTLRLHESVMNSRTSNRRATSALLLFTLIVPPAFAGDPHDTLVDPDPGELAAVLGPGFTIVPADGHDSHDPHDPHDHWTSGRADGHAPIGVMGDHTHNAGEWMFSVRAMRMHMEGMRSNQDSLTNAEVFAQGFAVTPTQMDMDMLMLGAMFAPTDDLTMMLMVPWIENSMDHVTGMGGRFTTESSGLGDVRVTGLLKVADDDGQRLHLNLGVSLPTGSIDEHDDTPAMANAKLPYPMQLGTGTFDLLPGLTWLGQSGSVSWGAQSILRLHLGENDEHYRHGNRIDGTAWIAKRHGEISTSLRLAAAHWSNIHGADPELNPAMVPTADPKLRGGDRVDALVGVNWYRREGALAGHRLALEFGVPIYQDLDGPQLETDWTLTLGWQLSL